MLPLVQGVSRAKPSPSEVEKDRSFWGCALRYLESTLYMLDAGVAKLV
jgi:hypothetical protein